MLSSSGRHRQEPSCNCARDRSMHAIKTYTVRLSTAGLVNELIEARDDKSLSKVVGRYARYELLILDELAYVPLTQPEAELLFQVLDERSEISAFVITTNLPSVQSQLNGPRSSQSRGYAKWW